MGHGLDGRSPFGKAQASSFGRIDQETVRNVAKRLVRVVASRQKDHDRAIAGEDRIYYHALSLSRVRASLPVRAWIGGPGTRRGFLSVRTHSTNYIASDIGIFFPRRASSSTVRASTSFSNTA